MDEIDRNSRQHAPVETLVEGEIASCHHCGRIPWPVTRNENGRHIEQCLYCLQRYDVAASA